MIKLMDTKEKRSEVVFGEVISDEPLVINIGELQIDESDNLYIADYLKKEHDRKFSAEGEQIIIKRSGSGNDIVGEFEMYAEDDDSFIQTEDTLEVGDTLLIIQSADKQTYSIVARMEEV